MLTTFTLDTNCIIAVEEARPESEAILKLANAHRLGNASVALVAISASERQKNGNNLETFTIFKERLKQLGLGHLDLLEPMLYFDVTFFDYCLWTDETMVLLEHDIHKVLFPNIDFLWSTYCESHGLNPMSDCPNHKWRNAKCDVQAYWSHAYRKRDVFVTSDQNFHKKTKQSQLIARVGGRILTPQLAIDVLNEEG